MARRPARQKKIELCPNCQKDVALAARPAHSSKFGVTFCTLQCYQDYRLKELEKKEKGNE